MDSNNGAGRELPIEHSPADTLGNDPERDTIPKQTHAIDASSDMIQVKLFSR